jgi:hypothetical protein
VREWMILCGALCEVAVLPFWHLPLYPGWESVQSIHPLVSSPVAYCSVIDKSCRAGN